MVRTIFFTLARARNFFSSPQKMNCPASHCVLSHEKKGFVRFVPGLQDASFSEICESARNCEFANLRIVGAKKKRLANSQFAIRNCAKLGHPNLLRLGECAIHDTRRSRENFSL